LWFVVCGLWFVVCGLRFAVCGYYKLQTTNYELLVTTGPAKEEALTSHMTYGTTVASHREDVRVGGSDRQCQHGNVLSVSMRAEGPLSRSTGRYGGPAFRV
jgi:hypothetical protein